jgi:UDP-N-acetylglucosamine 2-epimerase
MKPSTAFKKEITNLLMSLKCDIEDDFRAYEDDELPGMLITVGGEALKDGIAWSYQTGDNSFTGGAYGYQQWAVVSLHRRSNCKELAKDIYEQLFDL